MNLLNRYFGNEVYKDYASHAMRYLTGVPPTPRGRCPACCSPTKNSQSSRRI